MAERTKSAGDGFGAQFALIMANAGEFTDLLEDLDTVAPTELEEDMHDVRTTFNSAIDKATDNTGSSVSGAFMQALSGGIGSVMRILMRGPAYERGPATPRRSAASACLAVRPSTPQASSRPADTGAGPRRTPRQSKRTPECSRVGFCRTGPASAAAPLRCSMCATRLHSHRRLAPYPRSREGLLASLTSPGPRHHVLMDSPHV